MKRNAASAYQKEYIGSDVEIIKATHDGYLKIHGKVIDETKNTLTVKDNESMKTIPKKGTVFRLTVDGCQTEIIGDRILYNTEERIKRLG